MEKRTNKYLFFINFVICVFSIKVLLFFFLNIILCINYYYCYYLNYIPVIVNPTIHNPISIILVTQYKS